MSLGSRVRKLRDRKGLTQRELAELAGVRQSHISLIENDRRPNVTAIVAADIARALGVSLEYLLGLRLDPELQWMFDQIEMMSSEEKELVGFAIEMVLARRQARSQREEEPRGLSSVV